MIKKINLINSIANHLNWDADELILYKGTVNKFSEINQYQVQFQLKEYDRIFELFVDQSWVINREDEIVIAGIPDVSGKIACYAYANKNCSMQGWNNLQSNSTEYIFLCAALVFLYTGIFKFTPHLIASIFLMILSLKLLSSNYKKNKFYTKAFEMVRKC